MDKLENLRYFTFAHSLYWFEKTYNQKRDDIIRVIPSGGHGYVHCTIETLDGKFFISDECMAGMLLDWADVKGKGKRAR